MRFIDLAHRWLGGLIGLVLLVLGLTGAILAHRNAWIGLPGAHDAPVQTTDALAATVERLMADPSARPRNIVFASQDFGLNRLSYGRGAGGAYADQSGRIITRWKSKWERPEIWLFDLHEHLFSGDQGKTVVGVAGVCGLGFVITGLILWWPLRRGFELRPWPRDLARFSILRHHRDLGVVMAPLLALSFLTGAVMVFRPMTSLVLGPGAAAEVQASLKPPRFQPAPLSANPDWRGMITKARQLYPDAEVRGLSLPRKQGELISLRLRQPAEWGEDGRTTVWFAPDNGQLIVARDALTLPSRVQAYNAIKPLHTAGLGGPIWRWTLTLTGLVLTIMGGLTTWTFWFRRKRQPA